MIPTVFTLIVRVCLLEKNMSPSTIERVGVRVNFLEGWKND